MGSPGKASRQNGTSKAAPANDSFSFLVTDTINAMVGSSKK